MAIAQSPALILHPETAFFIVLKAREFHAKVEPVDPSVVSNPSDDSGVDVLQFHRDDAVVDERVSAIVSLDEDELMDHMGLIQVGRGEYSLLEWTKTREAARGADPGRVLDTILGTPMASDFLEDALGRFGHQLKDHLDSGFAATRDEILVE